MTPSYGEYKVHHRCELKSACEPAIVDGALATLLVALAGWMNEQQRDVIVYRHEENLVLEEQLGPTHRAPTGSDIFSSRARCDAAMQSCYGRDGCWLHRWLIGRGVGSPAPITDDRSRRAPGTVAFVDAAHEHAIR
jgi:hypothetical protein